MALMWLPFGLTPKPKPYGGVHYADIYARTLAAAVDMFLIFFVLQSLFYGIDEKMRQYADMDLARTAQFAKTGSEMMRIWWDASFIQAMLASYIAQLFIIGVLIISSQCIWQTTPGKRLLGIKIVRAETLEPIARWRYVLRFLAYIPATLPLMLGIFWASFNTQRRGWHDYIAGTVVIHTKPEGWYWEQTKRLWRTYVLKKDVSAD